MCSTPLVVTHPCALVRDALHRILTKSQFRPLRILPTLDEGAENYLGSAGICIWLLGVRECATNDLVRRVVAAKPSVRTVILAESHTAQDIVLALKAGVFGFLSQNIPSKQLIKSLELVALGQTVIHPQFHPAAFAQMAVQSHPTLEFEATSYGGYKAIAELPRHSEMQPLAALLTLPAAETAGTSNGGSAGDVVRALSRRELVILRTLTEGASNKVIALKLVITELTVKVHMKAILRKLRLQNRTQAAIWARTHLGELASSYAAVTSGAAL